VNATVKDVMTTHVVAVRKNASFKEMASRLREQRVSAFPVIDEGNKVVGVVSEADLMTKPPVTVGPNDLVTQAARLMYARKVKRLPVVDDDGRLVGIVSRTDVLSVYSRPDKDIRHDITEGIILDTLLCDPSRFTVTVKDGIVTVEGMPETAAVGHDLIEEIRHVEGVVAVRDRLSYPDERPVPGRA
jgi:CBS-domain-containing membrane protein